MPPAVMYNLGLLAFMALAIWMTDSAWPLVGFFFLGKDSAVAKPRAFTYARGKGSIIKDDPREPGEGKA